MKKVSWAVSLIVAVAVGTLYATNTIESSWCNPVCSDSTSGTSGSVYAGIQATCDFDSAVTGVEAGAFAGIAGDCDCEIFLSAQAWDDGSAVYALAEASGPYDYESSNVYAGCNGNYGGDGLSYASCYNMCYT
jgi:hypothetical protein